MKLLKLPVERRFEIPNGRGQKLVCYIKDEKSDTVMIICSGGAALADVPRFMKHLNVYHEELPINVLRFDFAGMGESDGEFELDLISRAHDLETVIEYCHMKWKRIILYGPSMGALVSCLVLKKNKHVDFFITLNGMFNTRDVGLNIKLQGYIYQILHRSNYRRQMQYIKDHLDLSKITIPTTVVYGVNDKWINPKQSLDFYNANPKRKRLLKYEEGDHFMTDDKDLPYTRAFARGLIEWVTANS